MPHPRARLLAATLVLVATGSAVASQYPAWGDTGWTYASGRYECCKEAIAIAQQYSAQACENTGGLASPPMGGGQRGSCQSQWSQDENGNILWRCQGEAALWCNN